MSCTCKAARSSSQSFQPPAKRRSWPCWARATFWARRLLPVTRSAWRPRPPRSRARCSSFPTDTHPLPALPKRRTALTPSVRRLRTVRGLLRPTGGRLLKVLLPPVGGHVEEAVGVCDRFSAARVRRVRVKHLAFELKEDAEAVLLTLHQDGMALRGRHLILVSIVVFGGRDLRVKRDVKVVVEIVAKRGKPRDAPLLFPLIGVELGEGGPRDH